MRGEPSSDPKEIKVYGLPVYHIEELNDNNLKVLAENELIYNSE